MFVHLHIIEYQAVGDSKAPFIQVIAVNRATQNSLSPLETPRLTNLDFKKLLLQNLQTLHVELRTDPGQSVPFTGTDKVVITLKVKGFD